MFEFVGYFDCLCNISTRKTASCKAAICVLNMYQCFPPRRFAALEETLNQMHTMFQKQGKVGEGEQAVFGDQIAGKSKQPDPPTLFI